MKLWADLDILPKLYYLAKKSKTGLLLFILEGQISMFYVFIFHLGRASYTLYRCLHQFSSFLLFISELQISIFYSRLYYLLWENKSYTIWIIKPMTKIRVIYLLWPTSFTTIINSKNPKNFSKKRAKINTARLKNKPILISMLY